MKNMYIRSLESEWLKRKNTAANWLILIGAFLIPVIFCIADFTKAGNLSEYYQLNDFWEQQFSRSWQIMAIFLLPLGVILASSLITQIEFKNNTWKQLHTLPIKYATTYFSKLSIILFMMLQFFILFNIGIYLGSIIPSIILKSVSYPKQIFPLMYFLKENGYYFIDCLPIIALQYLLCLKFKNFMVSIGIGLALFVGSLIAMSWEYNYVFPYIYCTLNFLKTSTDEVTSVINLHAFSLGYFIIITFASYTLYIFSKEKG